MNCFGPMTLMLALGLCSCADNKNKPDGSEEDAASPVINETDQTQTIEVDATDRSAWVGFDLDSASLVSTADFPTNGSWDLAFKRTSIKMNGSQVKMQILQQDFDGIELAPREGYASDQVPTDPAASETTGLAFHAEPAWYAYDINTHLVSSRGLAYIIGTNEGRYFKLKILDYYNAARLPAYMKISFQELTGVEP